MVGICGWRGGVSWRASFVILSAEWLVGLCFFLGFLVRDTTGVLRIPSAEERFCSNALALIEYNPASSHSFPKG